MLRRFLFGFRVSFWIESIQWNIYLIVHLIEWNKSQYLFLFLTYISSHYCFFVYNSPLSTSIFFLWKGSDFKAIFLWILPVPVIFADILTPFAITYVTYRNMVIGTWPTVTLSLRTFIVNLWCELLGSLPKESLYTWIS